MDSHDVNRARDFDALSRCPPGALVVAISSDGLFTLSELRDIAEGMPDARLEVIDSPEVRCSILSSRSNGNEGHDAFLIEFKRLDELLMAHLRSRLPEIYSGPPLVAPTAAQLADNAAPDSFEATRVSVFGEAEVDSADVSRW